MKTLNRAAFVLVWLAAWLRLPPSVDGGPLGGKLTALLVLGFLSLLGALVFADVVFDALPGDEEADHG